MRHSSFLVLDRVGQRHVRGGMGLIEDEIAGFEAHISVLGFWALVTAMKKEELNHSC